MIIYHEKYVLLQNVVGAKCIVCIHCLNIVGAGCGCSCTHCTHGFYAYVVSLESWVLSLES